MLFSLPLSPGVAEGAGSGGDNDAIQQISRVCTWRGYFPLCIQELLLQQSKSKPRFLCQQATAWSWLPGVRGTWTSHM